LEPKGGANALLQFRRSDVERFYRTDAIEESLLGICHRLARVALAEVRFEIDALVTL
jgi:hypothetical protein